MARIRTIKPEFWIDERVAGCSMPARLLFIAIWNFADDRGGIDRSAKQLKAQAFPHDVIDAEPLVLELLAQGLLVEYSANGRNFLHVRGWHHQKIDNPGKPRVPVYAPSAIPTGGVCETSPIPPVGLGEDSALSRNRKGREGKGKEGTRICAPAAPVAAAGSVPRETFDGWKFCQDRIRPEYPAGTYRDNAWVVASREIETLVGDGISPDDLVQAAIGYRIQQTAAGKIGTRFVLSPATFFHRGLGNYRGPFNVEETEKQRKERERIERQAVQEAEAWQVQQSRGLALHFRLPDAGESLDAYRTAIDAHVSEIEAARRRRPGSAPVRVNPRAVR